MDNIFDLQFFADGGGEGTAEGSNSGLTGDFETDFANTFASAGVAAASRQKRATGQTSAAQQPAEQPQTEPITSPDAGDETQTQTQTRDLDAEFEQMIKGDFKGAFQKRTQEIINQRFKNAKQADAVAAQYEDLLTFVYEKYGIAPGDTAALKAAIESDVSLVADEAARRHLPKEQVLAEKRVAKITAQQQQQQQQQTRKQADLQKWQDWSAQAAELSKTYPDFDLRSEILNNDRFGQLLDANLTVREAYETTHFAEIQQRVTQAAIQEAAARTAQSIAAQGKRPAEGSLGETPGVTVRPSVDSLTGSQIENILMRVERGEKISF